VRWSRSRDRLRTMLVVNVRFPPNPPPLFCSWAADLGDMGREGVLYESGKRGRRSKVGGWGYGEGGWCVS